MKVFISSEEGWRELTNATNQTLEAIEELSSTVPFQPITQEFTFTCKFGGAWISFLQECGLRKPRKTTYKTVKRDCAKRNRR